MSMTEGVLYPNVYDKSSISMSMTEGVIYLNVYDQRSHLSQCL